MSGLRRNASALYALYQRCLNTGLKYPHLESCSLWNLRAGLRTRADNARLHVHKPPSLESNLGQVHPLPALQLSTLDQRVLMRNCPCQIWRWVPCCTCQHLSVRPKAKLGTQSEEGKRRRNALNKRSQKMSKRARPVENRTFVHNKY